MIPELGHFALILALAVALVQASVPLVGAQLGIERWMRIARPAAWALMLCMAVAFGALSWAFVHDDFSVLYVANNSNTALPLVYKLSAVWGSHEGSLLLWATVLSLWTVAVSLFGRGLPLAMLSRVLSVMGMVSIGFLLFMLLTSNPFERVLPPPLEGRDLNPLLQDPGMAMHPPMLYMGYVGFSVAFAFAIAALIDGRLDAAWARWSRPWTTVAWMFLTLGITLGSWWAYNELGWGGWWFWDPVENASFMPWLVGTALVHSLAVTEKRGAFKAWTVLLAVFAFSLSLLGTFLVRSGVLTSVHAFATDPARGLFILAFLGVVVGGSLLLYAWRAPAVRSHVHFSPVSREAVLLLNNLLLVVTAASILLGTLYPLIVDALGVGKISVGAPYFNAVFVPLTLPLAFLVGVGAMLRWKQDRLERIWRHARWPAAVSLLAGLVLPLLFDHWTWQAALGIGLACWVGLTTLEGLRDRWAGRSRPLAALARTPRAFYGMSLAHFGIAVFVTGIALTTTYSLEKDVRLAPGESYVLGGYEFRMLGVHPVHGPNYEAQQGTLEVWRAGRRVAVLHPEKRVYRVQRNPMTEAAIDAGVLRDLFVALGEPLGSDGAWSVRLYYKPFIRWIWSGGLFMAVGGLLAATDRRYRQLVRRDARAMLEAVEATA
ncbi:MAG: heme lyase CcmF/NrfE family subunit [Gammaproteobacteria bacterium]|nr:MAG: heme lyase CcmF/NrfE family subunit [Gammaproteobacteria bacterium]